MLRLLLQGFRDLVIFCVLLCHTPCPLGRKTDRVNGVINTTWLALMENFYQSSIPSWEWCFRSIVSWPLLLLRWIDWSDLRSDVTPELWGCKELSRDNCQYFSFNKLLRVSGTRYSLHILMQKEQCIIHERNVVFVAYRHHKGRIDCKIEFVNRLPQQIIFSVNVFSPDWSCLIVAPSPLVLFACALHR